MSRGAAGPDAPPSKADQSQTRSTKSGLTPIQQHGTTARVRRLNVQKKCRVVHDPG